MILSAFITNKQKSLKNRKQEKLCSRGWVTLENAQSWAKCGNCCFQSRELCQQKLRSRAIV